MKWKNIIKTALKSLFKSRMRSLLTTLGIVIGVGAVIIMVAIGEGAQVEIANQINALGSNLIVVFPGASQSGGVSRGAGSFNRFTFADVEKIEKEGFLIDAVSPVVRTGGQIIGGGRNWNSQVWGVSPTYLDIRDWKLASGEFFTERDIRARSKVAVLGKIVADNLFPDMDPVGEQIRIRNVPFKVVGVLAEKGQSFTGNDQDDIILCPSSTVHYRLSHGRFISFIYAKAVSHEKINAAQEELRQIMREAHRLNIGDDDDFTIRNQTEITEAASESSRVMTLLLGSVAGVSLIVGGIGIMNIMLVSVTERTREIGIRLSVGAREGDILTQFLVEAVVLSLVGGLIGISLAFLVVYILTEYTSQIAIINPTIIFISVIFSAFIGIFFGFYPAKKAAALNPIDALRYE